MRVLLLNHPEAIDIVKDIYVNRAMLDCYELAIIQDDEKQTPGS